MTYNTIDSARKSVPSLKNLSDPQVKTFISTFNSLVKQGTKESDAIPIAIAQAKKTVEKENVRASAFTLVSKKVEVERDSSGNLVYRGKKFAGFNKPRASDLDGKDGMVLAKEGNTIKLIHFGDSSLPHNQSSEANDRYYSRFGDKPSSKLSAEYWSSSWLWPKGENKGKGGKPWVPLKKGNEMNKLNLLEDLLNLFKESKMEEDLSTLVEEFEEVVEDLAPIDKSNTIEIVKQFDEDQMIAIEPLYINVGESDAHEDGITDEELDKLIDNFNKNIDNIKGNIHHKFMTSGFKPLKAYRFPMDVYVGNPEKPQELTKIPEGQPIVKIKFSDSDIGKDLWQKRKEGVLRGVSIGAKGSRIDNPDYKEE